MSEDKSKATDEIAELKLKATCAFEESIPTTLTSEEGAELLSRFVDILNEALNTHARAVAAETISRARDKLAKIFSPYRNGGCPGCGYRDRVVEDLWAEVEPALTALKTGEREASKGEQ